MARAPDLGDLLIDLFFAHLVKPRLLRKAPVLTEARPGEGPPEIPVQGGHIAQDGNKEKGRSLLAGKKDRLAGGHGGQDLGPPGSEFPQ